MLQGRTSEGAHASATDRSLHLAAKQHDQQTVQREQQEVHARIVHWEGLTRVSDICKDICKGQVK